MTPGPPRRRAGQLRYDNPISSIAEGHSLMKFKVLLSQTSMPSQRPTVFPISNPANHPRGLIIPASASYGYEKARVGGRDEMMTGLGGGGGRFDGRARRTPKE